MSNLRPLLPQAVIVLVAKEKKKRKRNTAFCHKRSSDRNGREKKKYEGFFFDRELQFLMDEVERLRNTARTTPECITV